jgi:hypothetical protein
VAKDEDWGEEWRGNSMRFVRQSKRPEEPAPLMRTKER